MTSVKIKDNVEARKAYLIHARNGLGLAFRWYKAPG